MSFIGIDLGTSFIKGAVLNLDARQLEHTHRIAFPNRLQIGNPLVCEFDPKGVANAVRGLIDNLALHVSGCEGIIMCSQMHGMVLMNERGDFLSNCISWLDHRGMMPHPSGSGSYLDVLMDRTTAAQRRQLGNELGLERPGCFLFCLAEQGKLEPGLIPVSIPDFVLSVLCNAPPKVERTNAAAFGLFNLESLDWHHEVIECLGLSDLQFPAVRTHEGEVVGYVKVGAHDVPCYTPVGDLQCALVGALLQPEELSLNISTGSQVSRLTTGLTLGDYQTRPFFEGKFLNTVTDAPGGRSLNVLVSFLTELTTGQKITNAGDPWTSIAEAARKIPDTDLEVDLSFFASESGSLGRISNIRADNLTAGHLFRAAFKEMAEVDHTYALRLWPEGSWKNIVFSGGLAYKLEDLRKAIQKKFEAEYRLCSYMEDTLFGLLILASVFSGRASSIGEVSKQLRSAESEVLKM